MSIQKLKIKTAEEVKKELSESELGESFSSLFGPLITPQMPSEVEVMNKINEIIEHVNKLEEEAKNGKSKG